MKPILDLNAFDAAEAGSRRIFWKADFTGGGAMFESVSGRSVSLPETALESPEG